MSDKMSSLIELPFELLVAILAYIRPREALQLSIVCSRFNTVLHSMEWAADALTLHVGPSKPHVTRSFKLTENEVLFLNGNPQLQAAYARKYLASLDTIIWHGELEDICYRHPPRTIPVALSSLTHLNRLTMSACNRVGSIPPELGDLKSLRALDLSNNELSGVIPSELGSLAHLEVLVLSNNLLGGPIPVSLAKLGGLYRLVLSGNKLEGRLPAALGQLKSLQQLLSQLVILDMSRNSLSGTIPSELGSLLRLSVLRLNNNHLIGEIPVELTRLRGLNIDISNNLLRRELSAGIQLHEVLALVLAFVVILVGVFGFFEMTMT
ncbi:hypothetical protein HDU79_009228 [Rhizoclosmatium sp. JEL0117]|nr:hypothetical protein HDU79_009228 [Rhizoclosmatium sp. JEL0117]